MNMMKKMRADVYRSIDTHTKGITPMLQVLEEVLSEEDDKTHVSLVFANNTEQDIILKNRLDALAKKHPNRFEVHYVVAQPADAASWKGHTGFINADIVKKHIPGPAEDVMVYVCGPPPFYKALSGNKAPDYTQGEVRPVSPFPAHTHTSPHAPHTPHAPTNAATLCVRSPSWTACSRIWATPRSRSSSSKASLQRLLEVAPQPS